MAPPAEKQKKLSSVYRRQSQKNEFMTSFGRRRRVAKKKKRLLLRKIWICNDLWLHILPFLDHAQLGLKLALLSCRFDALVDKHFNGKPTWTTRRSTRIQKDLFGEQQSAELSVIMEDFKTMAFPLPERPLSTKIRFRDLQIAYIDHSVISFLRSNQQIFDGGTDLNLLVYSSDGNVMPIWTVLVREIMPIFAANIHHLAFSDGSHFVDFLHFSSPTILSDLKLLNSINSGHLLPCLIGDDFSGQKASAVKALIKWLHTPTTDGQPKRLCCTDYNGQIKLEWIKQFKKAFLRASTTRANYEIHLHFKRSPSPTESFEMVNERTQEKLTLNKEAPAFASDIHWLLKRCPKIGGTTDRQKGKKADALSSVRLRLYDDFTLGNYLRLRRVKTKKRSAASPRPNCHQQQK